MSINLCKMRGFFKVCLGNQCEFYQTFTPFLYEYAWCWDLANEI